MDRQELQDTLPEADRAGVFSLPAGDASVVAEVAAEQGFAIFRVNLAGCSRTDQVLARLAEQLRFPDWFGQNWDALADCLTDFSWSEADGYALILEQLAGLRAADDESFDTLIEILSDASASWSGLGIPFWVFLVLEPPIEAGHASARAPAPGG